MAAHGRPPHHLPITVLIGSCVCTKTLAQRYGDPEDFNKLLVSMVIVAILVVILATIGCYFLCHHYYKSQKTWTHPLQTFNVSQTELTQEEETELSPCGCNCRPGHVTNCHTSSTNGNTACIYREAMMKTNKGLFYIHHKEEFNREFTLD